MLKDALISQGSLAAILCSSYPLNEARYSWLNRKLVLYFDDTVNERCDRCFSDEQAKQIMTFWKKLDDTEQLYVCCDSGESRSTAIAAALYRSLVMDEMAIWENPHFHPNTLVYKRLCVALGVPSTENEIAEKKRINYNALARVIRSTR